MGQFPELEDLRPRLFGLAYRMLGSRQEAEDAVQEAFLRLHQKRPPQLRSLEAWLITVLSRICVDRMRSMQAEIDAYVGPWLPEPLTTECAPPDRAVELASDLSMALLVVLQRLSPEERVGFLMHDVFDCAYADVSAALDKSETACRQLVSRARKRVARDKPRFEVPIQQHEQLVERYAQALQERDAKKIAKLLSPDAVFVSDGGGKAWAALRPVVGAKRIARMEIGVLRKLPQNLSLQLRSVNGRAGTVGIIGERAQAVTAFETDGTRITSIMRMLNPEKLSAWSPASGTSRII